MNSFRSEAPVRKDPHQYFGRSVEYFGVKKGSKPSPSLSPTFTPSISASPSPVNRVMNEEVPRIGLQSPGESPINRKFYPRSPQTKTTSSLFSSPHRASPSQGFGDRIEADSAIKTDSHDENYEQLLGAMSQSNSPQETQQLKQLENDSLIQAELIRCRTEEVGGGGALRLDSTDSLGQELKTPGASDLLARSAQDFPVRDYDEDSGSSLYWTPQPRKKSYRQSLFRPPKIKFEDSRGESINQPSSILSSARPSKASELKAEILFTDIDVTDCELKPYAIYRREEVMSQMLDICYPKRAQEWEDNRQVAAELRPDHEKRIIDRLNELEWKIGIGRYAQDFLTAVLKQKLVRFAEKCPWLHSKYSMKEIEEEPPAHCSIRMEASLFRPRPQYLWTQSKHTLMKEDEALLFLQGINPSNQDNFLHRSLFIGQKHDEEGQSTDSVNERTAGVLRAVDTLKQQMSEVWSARQQLTLSHPGHHFKTTLYNFKCLAQCLLFKEGISLLCLILSYQHLSQMWEESASSPDALMTTWAVLVLLSLAFGLILLQPLKIMLQLHIYLKCRQKGQLRGLTKILLNGHTFEKIKNDRELVSLYQERRRDYRLIPLSLDSSHCEKNEQKNEQFELKRRLQRLYALIWLEK